MTLQMSQCGVSRKTTALATLFETKRWVVAGCTAILLLPVVFGSSQVGARGKTKAPVRANASANAELRKRVRQLEEQFLDMQVMIGTLQSMSRSGGGGSSARLGPTGGVSAGNVRMRQLETQIQALTAQLQQLSNKISGRRSDAGAVVVPDRQYADRASSAVASSAVPSLSVSPLSGSSPSAELRPSSAPYAAPRQAGTTEVAGFGSTTVTPSAGRALSGNAVGAGDGIGAYLSRNQSAAAQSKARRMASRGGDPKQLYETAYGYLLQQNFGSARSAFADFLELYPNDPLAGNAQYWLGETYYVRNKYRAAAKAFLKGYRKYGHSNKAPDSLLKLAMSFDRLGQKDAACSSFGELKSKFPRASSHVKNRAQSESKRLGC